MLFRTAIHGSISFCGLGTHVTPCDLTVRVCHISVCAQMYVSSAHDCCCFLWSNMAQLYVRVYMHARTQSHTHAWALLSDTPES